MTAVITTDRLMLRPWKDADASEAVPLFGHGPGTAWPPEAAQVDEAEVASAIRGWTARDVADGTPAGHWAVELAAGSTLIGACSLVFGEPGPESLKLRWLLGASAWGSGYATEAGAALISWAMHQGGVHEVYAVIEPDNRRAKATAGRLGMELVGETGRYRHNKLHVYRVRHGDLPYHEEPGDAPIAPTSPATSGTWIDPHKPSPTAPTTTQDPSLR